MTSNTREVSEERLIQARWRGTPACPACGSGRAAPIRATTGHGVGDAAGILSDNMFHGFVDGVKVDVFRALPTNDVASEKMRWICPGTRISGMDIGSIPDLMATKLDTIIYRAKLRNYLDLVELDRSGARRTMLTLDKRVEPVHEVGYTAQAFSDEPDAGEVLVEILMEGVGKGEQ